jgi:hypothetical protein
MYEHSKGRTTFQKSWNDKKRENVEQRMRVFKPPSSFRSSPNVYHQIHVAHSESKMAEYSGKRPRSSIKCLGCKGDHLYQDFPHKEYKMRIVQSLQTIVEDEGINIPRIYVAFEDRHVEHQSHMIEVEGKIINQHVSILIDSGASHNYILTHKMVN